MGTHCFYSVIKQLLEYWNITIGEADLYFLSDGLNASFPKSNSDSQLRYCNFSPYDRLLVRLAEQLDFQTEIHWMNNQKDCALFRQQLQELSAPMILCIDQNQLSYHQVRSKTKMFHFILLYNSSQSKESVCLHDTFVLCNDGKVVTHHELINKEECPTDFFCYINLWPRNASCRAIKTNLSMIKKRLAAFIVDEQNEDNYYGNCALRYFFTQFDQIGQEAIHRDTAVNIVAMFKTYYMPVFDYLLQILIPLEPEFNLLNDLRSIKNSWESMFITLLMFDYSKNLLPLMKRVSNEGKRLADRQKDVFTNILQL